LCNLIYFQGTAELETLRRTNQELGQGKVRLESLLSRLEREGAELDKSIAVLQEKETELDKALARLSEQEPIDVDEAVTTTAPLYKQ
jgi:ESCRT-I complex subunit TSG101